MPQPVSQGRQTLRQVFRPTEEEQGKELVAEGFCFDVGLTASLDGRPVSWTEPRWLVRSQAFAESQQQQLDKRLAKAREQLAQLGQRKQGKKRPAAGPMAQDAEQVVQE